ncbi:putative nuclease HARBI1 [Plutella xylostella]|uniref:putative nuclease HARBI1 n=1 Tax=Plutella xylostella TaxID=51655 RepID=UPI002032B8DB|nr:putative nuclease HARBI1 [Plutella xylostella]
MSDFIDTIEAIELITDRVLWDRPRIFRERTDYFQKYDDLDFFRRFRLTKRSVLFLLTKIESKIEFQEDRNHSIPPINQLLMTLRYYATGNHLLAIGDLGGFSVASCSRIVKRVTEAIVSLRAEFIKFPESEEEQRKVKRDFFKIAKFPNVLGCIDCTHVRIQSPGGDDAEIFRNRKGYMSINVQTISTAQLLVTDVVARWPGSTHDSAIYQNSNRYNKFERGDYGCGYLLGDSGYPLKSHLLTPHVHPITQGQQRFNEAQIKTRNVVERQYGVLKRRFPVLAVGIRLKLKTAVNVILACCILHNFCILNREPEPANEGLLQNLNELIDNGQIHFPLDGVADPIYGFRRDQL